MCVCMNTIKRAYMKRLTFLFPYRCFEENAFVLPVFRTCLLKNFRNPMKLIGY
jgi:hypothetical protein